MEKLRRPGFGDGEGGRARQRATAVVLALTHARIVRALAARKRYKYVHPRVVPEGAGWKILSPNCSRSVDATGGEIDIAWLTPAPRGLWDLYARDHVHGCWWTKASGLSLPAALALLCEDPQREFWR
jgi:hypothetical protein